MTAQSASGIAAPVVVTPVPVVIAADNSATALSNPNFVVTPVPVVVAADSSATALSNPNFNLDATSEDED